MFLFFANKKHSLHILYIVSFLMALHFAVAAYINSTFIATNTGEEWVGVIYTVASLLAILLIIFTPLLLKKVGNLKVFLSFIMIQIASLLGLALFKQLLFIIPFFIINQILISLMALNMDVFLEHYDSNEDTGRLRGTVLTIANFAFLIGIPLSGFILTNGDFWRVYLISSIILLPVFFLIYIHFKDFKDPEYTKTPFVRTLQQTFRNKDMRAVLIVNYILKFFFAWMVIYTPIYLYSHIGFEWSTIGIIFFVMILPYVIFELPLGRIADKLTGEKEFMIGGFIIAALFTLALSMTASVNPAWWAFLLFGTRIGASFVEITTETHFFKHVDEGDTDTISLYRIMRPLAYVTAPLMASLFIPFIEFQHIFLVLVVILFLGAFSAFFIKDTR